MMKNEIIKKIYRDDHVSFVEVERIFEKYQFDYRGDKTLHHEEYPHLIIWAGWNEEAVDLVADVLKQEAICLQTTHNLTYLIDGGGLSVPIAKGIKNYKKDHWLPMVLRPESKCRKNK